MIRQVVVIVPAADEEQRIARCLTSIHSAQHHLFRRAAHVQVQIIVALDSCRDGTAAICASFPRVTTVTTTSRSAGEARRAGSSAALRRRCGPVSELWLASTDADSEVPADWLTVMVAAAGQGADLVLGTVLPGPGLTAAARARWLARHHLRDGHPHVHGANFGIRAGAYLALGGWPPLAVGEDAELARRAMAAGHLRITRTATIPVVTSPRAVARAPHGFSSYLHALSPPARAAVPAAVPVAVPG